MTDIQLGVYGPSYKPTEILFAGSSVTPRKVGLFNMYSDLNFQGLALCEIWLVRLGIIYFQQRVSKDTEIRWLTLMNEPELFTGLNALP